MQILAVPSEGEADLLKLSSAVLDRLFFHDAGHLHSKCNKMLYT